MGQHLDGRGVHRHQRCAQRHRAARLRRAVRLRRPVAPSRSCVVHVGHRHPGCRPALLRYHRMAHRVRHVLGHSSGPPLQSVLQLRHRTSTEMEHQRRRIPAGVVPLFGVPPWIVFASFSINLVYQFWIHTERIGKLWRPIEFIFNTPSHHRVHHGVDQVYLDKNYGGILILWDRLFGSFARDLPAALRPHQAGRHLQHLDVADPRVRRDRPRRPAADCWRDRLGFLLRPPGWGPRDSCNPTLRHLHRFVVG